MVADVAGVVSIHELERAVVQCQPQNAHVVGVHHSVAKTHRLPLRNHQSGALCHRLKQVGIRVTREVGRAKAFGVIAFNHIVGQRFELRQLIARCKVLKVTKANEGWCHSGDYCSGFHGFPWDRFV